jgi:diaminopimelate dehydrogenase
MTDRIRAGIVGYGNIGRGVEAAIGQNPDMELAAVFTRRPTDTIPLSTDGIKASSVADIDKLKDDIDVLILCGGSATDLPQQGPFFARICNTVDSYDTHARIPQYFDEMNNAAKSVGNTAVIATGWDPGLFSMMRMLAGAVLPEGNDYTFWGKGVSQGHSDAIRRVKGVKNAIQYTIPIEPAVKSVRSGSNPELATREKHLRECFVVAEDGADKAEIEKAIATMPNYFSDYDTAVHFVSEKELKKNHSGMPHGGFVFRSGVTGTNRDTKQIIEFSLKLESNPEFTAGILVAYARAAVRMNKEGNTGAKTVFDVPLGYLSGRSGDELRSALL